MEKTYRTFIAVKIIAESELLTFIDQCRKTFAGEHIKWVEEKNLHLTLKFLGETTEAQIAEIEETLIKIASQFQPFNFMLEGTGYFKSGRQPSVVFAGIKNLSELESLAAGINVNLANVGFSKETRAFKPHLTLGRINFLKDKKRFYDFLEEYKDTRFQQVKVDEIVFYQSILKPTGPVYIPLQMVKINTKV
jgi:RNA 2',3'-cyclic 3'-phosphodiesterase